MVFFIQVLILVPWGFDFTVQVAFGMGINKPDGEIHEDYLYYS